jgi:hypothetical protein
LLAMAAAAAAAAGPAEAAGKPRRPPAVQRVLQHLQSHPMTVTSQLMQYDAAPSTPLPECLSSLTPADVQLPGTKQPDYAAVLLAALQVSCSCVTVCRGMGKGRAGSGQLGK